METTLFFDIVNLILESQRTGNAESLFRSFLEIPLFANIDDASLREAAELIHSASEGRTVGVQTEDVAVAATKKARKAPKALPKDVEEVATGATKTFKVPKGKSKARLVDVAAPKAAKAVKALPSTAEEVPAPKAVKAPKAPKAAKAAKAPPSTAEEVPPPKAAKAPNAPKAAKAPPSTAEEVPAPKAAKAAKAAKVPPTKAVEEVPAPKAAKAAKAPKADAVPTPKTKKLVKSKKILTL